MAAGDPAVVTRVDPDGRTEIAWERDAPGQGTCVDFRRVAVRGIGRQPIVRACGGRGRIVDATAGLGGDAWLLAAAGSTVVAFERSPLVAQVLEDGLRRARADERLAAIAARIELRTGDSIALLRGVDCGAGACSAIYMDPMYPPKDGSALPAKGIRLVRAAVGSDGDATALLLAAAATGCARLVVKRPHHAPHIVTPPDAQVESKLVRYDIYAGAGRGLRTLRERAA